MGQQANSGRQASLDDQKERAAGRQNQKSAEVEAIADSQSPLPAKGATGGAFGKTGDPSNDAIGESATTRPANQGRGPVE